MNNIACFKDDCNNSVRGQCSGYKGNCGRFFCSEHSQDALCGVCVAKKGDEEEAIRQEREVQRLIDEYTEIAEQLDKNSNKVSNVFNSLITTQIISHDEKLKQKWVDTYEKYEFKWQRKKKWTRLGCLSVFVYAGLGYMFLISYGIDNPGVDAIFIPLLIIFAAVIVILLGIAIVDERKHKKLNDNIKNDLFIPAIEKERPGFSEFYEAWEQYKKAKNKQKLKNALIGTAVFTGKLGVGMAKEAHRQGKRDGLY